MNARLAQECANNACAILAMGDEGEHEVSAVVAETVAHRIAMADEGESGFTQWRGVDAAEAREVVGKLVGEWLRRHMSPAEHRTFEAAIRMGATASAAAELATREVDLAAGQGREARRAAECWS